MKKEITLAITGASGAIYALNLLSQLVKHFAKVHLMISDAGRIVMASEQSINLPENPTKLKAQLIQYLQCDEEKLAVYAKENWNSPVASGSAAPKQMVICPASMGCVSAVASGASNNLIERAADVVLKEKGQLILLPREMPYSTIHLKNLTLLSEIGVTIMPASPGFYQNPTCLDDLANFVSGRVLDHLGIDNGLVEKWGYASK